METKASEAAIKKLACDIYVHTFEMRGAESNKVIPGIIALIDTAFAAEREVTRELVAAAKAAMPYVEQAIPVLGHSCGDPNAMCDMECVEAAHASEVYHKFQAAIAKATKTL